MIIIEEHMQFLYKWIPALNKSLNIIRSEVKEGNVVLLIEKEIMINRRK